MPRPPRRLRLTIASLAATAAVATAALAAPSQAQAEPTGAATAAAHGQAQDTPSATALTLTSSAVTAAPGTQLTLTAHLTTTAGPGDPTTAMAGVPVVFHHRVHGTDQTTTATTSSDGSATYTLTASADNTDNSVYASFEGDDLHAPATSNTVTVTARLARAVHTDVTGPTTAMKLAGVRLTSHTVTIPTDGTPATPAVGVTVTFQRNTGNGWHTITTVRTNDTGEATVQTDLPATPAISRYRALTTATSDYKTSTSSALKVTGTNWSPSLRLNGAHRIVDEHRLPLTVTWRTRTGRPVPGTVILQRLLHGRWVKVAKVALGGDGAATLALTPRTDVTYRAVGNAGPWWNSSTTARFGVDNLPPGPVVHLPKDAPQPRIHLPAQPRATTAGAHPVITGIPDAVWNHMVGRSWHAGCPVGRVRLRLLQINYWGYDGYRHQGTLIAAAPAMPKISAALTDMYNHQFPIRSMYLVDRFGYSAKLHGGNDYASMAAGNTSAFNCRQVTNRPGHLSPHSFGTALDLNTWENPYRSPTGLVPNTWWQSHTMPKITARTPGDPIVQLMRRHGLQWTYGLGDTQHFDA